MNGLLTAALVCWVLCSSTAGYKVENVALRGRATMSSILAGSNANNGYLGHAINAIDGNKNPHVFLGSCAHTNSEMSPWWRVDLLTPHVIQYVTITNTILAPERMNGAELLIGNSLASNGNDNPRWPCDLPDYAKCCSKKRCTIFTSIPSAASQTFQCNGMVGRYVNIIIRGRAEYLTPCEVEVYGYPEDQSCTCAKEPSFEG